jgi:predicted PhzF superfamily epimerase YddE/YHI9
MNLSETVFVLPPTDQAESFCASGFSLQQEIRLPDIRAGDILSWWPSSG